MDPNGPNPRQNVWGPTAPGDQSGELIATAIRPSNARLIAAAPELLAACLAALAVLDAVRDGAIQASDVTRPMLRAAIAKAEGR